MSHKLRHVLLFSGLLVLGLGVIASCGKDKKSVPGETQSKQAKTGKQQLWTCGMHPDVILDHPGQCPKCGMNLVPVKAGVDEAPSEHNMDMPMDTKHPKAPGDSGHLSYTCPMHPEVHSDHPGQCPQCGMNLVPEKAPEKASPSQSSATGKGKILYWQAPMDPTEIYDHPGKSKMGMDLVPVYENQVAKSNLIKIDPTTEQNMGVRTMVVQRKNFSRTVRTVGIIEYDEQNIFVVSSKISGWVEQLQANATGQPVRKGQTLLKIYSPDLVTTQQEFLLALQNKQNAANSPLPELRQSADALLQASLKRLLYWDIPRDQIKQLEKSGKVQKLLALESPVNGVIIHKNVVQGMFVKKGSDLYRIADLSRVWVQATIYDTEASWIRPGQSVKVQLSYDPQKEYKGKIAYIYPYLNEKTRSLKVRIELSNPRQALKPGMFAQVYLQGRNIPQAIVIPSEAVIRSGKRNVVFVDRGKGRFEPREVRLGEEDGNGNLRVLGGLLADEKIVVSAQFMLDSESRLQEAIRKMLAERQKNAG